MAVSDEFVDYVVDQLSGWGQVSVRRMFGGAGLYRDGTMFGLIAHDVAYLKVDDASREDFLKAGSVPFHTSYYSIPADVLDSRDELARWAQRALEIATG